MYNKSIAFLLRLCCVLTIPPVNQLLLHSRLNAGPAPCTKRMGLPTRDAMSECGQTKLIFNGGVGSRVWSDLRNAQKRVS